MTFNRPVLCPDCGEDLNIGDLQVFTFPGQCAKCQSVSKMVDSKTQEDLVQMFSNNMNFANPQVQQLQQLQQPTNPLPPPSNGLGYSPSRPYHHSSHQALPTGSAFQPQYSPDPLALAKAQLAAHRVSPSNLEASQLVLFSQARDDQKLRLIQLWQLASQNNTPYSTFGAGEPTSPNFTNHDHDDMQMEDSAPAPAPTPTTYVFAPRGEQEPYMTSGYEMLAAREYENGAQRSEEQVTYSPLGSALGPDATRNPQLADETKAMLSEGWWRHEPAFGQDQPVEHQYGLYQQMGCWGVEARR